jgi:hypothetical protein
MHALLGMIAAPGVLFALVALALTQGWFTDRYRPA